MDEPIIPNECEREPGWSRGHPYAWDDAEGCFIWTDTGEPVDFRQEWGHRACAACGLCPNEAGHDPCIKELPGVRFACCGHGRPYSAEAPAYVTFLDGTNLRGEEAMAYFHVMGREVPHSRGVFPVKPVE